MTTNFLLPSLRPARAALRFGVLFIILHVFAAAAESARTFDVPAGDALVSLRTFSAQSGEQLFYSADDVSSVKTVDVKGTLTSQEALDRMFRGTGLVAIRDQKTRAFTISRPDPNVARAAQTTPSDRPDRPASEERAEEPDEILVLTPFQVDASQDHGYTATNTEAGSRLNAKLMDTPAPISVMTTEFLQDIGAIDVGEALEFAVNTETYREDDGAQDHATVYRMRGIRSFQIGRNFFLTSSRGDTYNIERLTFSRGPNSILFGAADPAGIINYNTKRAQLGRRSVEAGVRVDDREGWRTTLDINQPIIKNRLAVRLNVLKQDLNGYRTPDYTYENAYHLAGTLKVIDRPNYKLTLRGDYENTGQHRLLSRLDTVTDRVTPWIQAGRPSLDVPGTANNSATRPAGITNISTNHFLVSVDQSPTPIPVLNWRNMGRGANWPDGVHQIATGELWPLYINAHGPGNYSGTEFNNGSVYLEQQFGRKLFVEISFNDYYSERKNFKRGSSVLDVDVNRVLPNGDPNPNFGRYYFETTALAPQFIIADESTLRVAAAYELDLRRTSKWLGNHRFATAWDYREDARLIHNVREVNTTPLPGTSRLLSNNAHIIYRRSYVDRDAGIVSGNMSLEPIVSNGINSAWLPIIAPTVHETRGDSVVGALQSYWFNDRVVTTYGLRYDKIDSYELDPSVAADDRGVWPAASKALLGGEPLGTQEVTTSSLGVVFHATKHVSLFFNRADNFSPETTTTDIFGNSLKNPVGKGRDYGIKFSLFENKLSGNIGTYRSSKKSQFDSNSAPFRSVFNAVWDALEEPQESPRRPGGGSGRDYRQTRDIDAEGYEMELTYNVTNNWRIAANASYNKTVLNNRGPQSRAYVAQHLDLWRANGNVVTGNGDTINERLEDSVLDEFRLYDASAGSAAPHVRRLTYTFVTNYSFRNVPVLKGVSIGGSLRYADKPIIGYGNNAQGLPDNNLAYHGNDYHLVGAHARYQRRLWNDRVRWTIQLNIRNALDFDDPLEMRATATGRVNRYNLLEPRAFILTNTFRF